MDTRIDTIEIAQIEVTGFGDLVQSYRPGEIVATGAVALPGHTTLALRTTLTPEECAALMALCEAIGARVRRELAGGLR